jgi:hypothetical protein
MRQKGMMNSKHNFFWWLLTFIKHKACQIAVQMCLREKGGTERILLLVKRKVANLCV